MNQAALRYLRDLGGICGAPVRVDGRKRKCLRRPGHGEFCSPEWPRVITREDRLLRDVAKLKAQRDRRQAEEEREVELTAAENGGRATRSAGSTPRHDRVPVRERRRRAARPEAPRRPDAAVPRPGRDDRGVDRPAAPA
jgi:hypothetical protein